MPDFPSLAELARVDQLGTITSSNGPQVTKAGTPNTKGAWVQLIASTAYPSAELWVTVNFGSGTSDCLFDVGVGAAGQEQVIVGNLMLSQGNISLGVQVRLPVVIPQGSRVAARIQSSITTNSPNALAYLGVPAWTYPNGLQVFDDLGTTLGTSRGTNIDCGATPNTKSAYVQLVASTARAYRGLLVLVGNGGRAASPGAASVTLDIARGPSGQEQIILPDLLCRGQANNIYSPTPQGPFMLDLPAGERLAARAQSSTAVATDRLLDVQLIGMA